MLDPEAIKRHIKTHSERSDEDRSAVAVLRTFLRSDGKINPNFSCDDKWPNTDGTFEYVANPDISRQPEQNFFIQIKGTSVYSENAGVVKYSLKSLAFPAFIYNEITLDPGILFVVLNPDERGSERVFWKYMSMDFITSIDYEKNSATISFTAEEEIKNTNESIDAFCDKLVDIIKHHLFVKKLDSMAYTRVNIERIITGCDEQIAESIERFDILNVTRDDVSRRILNRLEDLCVATLLLNALSAGVHKVNVRLAWERALFSLKTKYLATFLESLKYIGNRIPDDGQSERLLLKYYDFLWQIREFLQESYGISILHNLEKFPLCINELDYKYYELVADAIDSVDVTPKAVGMSRFYIQKKTPFFIGTKRYYEITLQLAGAFATKYNRITVYTKMNISSGYSVQISYTDATIDLWGIDSKIKVITNWKVSIEPSCLNKLAMILHIGMRLTSRYGEYVALMDFLTQTGINFLDLIDLQEIKFLSIINQIYAGTNTYAFKEVLLTLRRNYSETSKLPGRNVIRYLLLNLREETIEDVLPTRYAPKCLCPQLCLSNKCYPFDKNPFISNLAGRKTSENNQIGYIARVAGNEKIEVVRPYLSLRNAIKQTGEIYFESSAIASKDAIREYNSYLDSWERKQGYKINQKDGFVSIDSYEKTTIDILHKLLEFSRSGNKGQREFNQNFIRRSNIKFEDPLKEQALKNIFVNSQLLLIYGAAGTGKTTLINHISNMMSGHKKLFLTKTHTALQNLKRRIENPGESAGFVSIDSFTKKASLSDYDIIFVDECSTIDNRIMSKFLEIVKANTFLVLAGDIHQIESIDFGNWFFYAKDIIKSRGANVELLNTWRTKDETLISLWNEVRNRGVLVTEKLVIDGPFSEDIGPDILKREVEDEVVLCLNYDGKFGLNNMNNYFQNANPNGKAFLWQEWAYKVGDYILFNETKRFSILYNNLKGRIAGIKKENGSITFTIDAETILTEKDCLREELEFIGIRGKFTRIRFTVYAYDSGVEEEDREDMRMKSVVPFQLAYAVSIHKAQGLEYDSVKVIIPSNNSEKITHGIFYTAITRAKKKLKIYWSSETMNEVVKSFSVDETKYKSLEIVKEKLNLEGR